MSGRPRMREAAQNDFLKEFERLTRVRSDWQAWADFVNLAACSISNAVDRGPRWQEREDRYMQIAKPYKPEELDIFAHLLAMTVEALEINPDQDFLGEMFMALDLGSHWHGQFFTPYSVCKAMAAMTIGAKDRAEIERRGYVSVNDPACGAGALLIAAANTYRTSGIEYQQHIMFVAQDIDQTAAMMCYIQLSLLGCPGYVIVGDTLRHPPTEPLPPDYEIWYTPFYFTDVWVWRRMFHSVDKLISGTTARARKTLAAEVEEAAEDPNQELESVCASGSKKGREYPEQLSLFS